MPAESPWLLVAPIGVAVTIVEMKPVLLFRFAAIAGGATGVRFHHLSQLYPSQQAMIGYIEPSVGAIVTIAVAVALNEN